MAQGQDIEEGSNASRHHYPLVNILLALNQTSVRIQTSNNLEHYWKQQNNKFTNLQTLNCHQQPAPKKWTSDQSW